MTARRSAAATRRLAATVHGRWAITIQADITDYKPAQVEKAREAIEQGAILPTSRTGLFATVSSDGSTTYLVHGSGCTCPAGQRDRYLRWHRAAPAILTAAAPARRAA